MKLSTCFILLGSTLIVPTSGFASTWNDNSVSVRYGTEFSEAGVGKDISKTIFNFTHASGDKYGTNFFTVDNLISDKKDLAANSDDGAQEIYGFYQRTLLLSSIPQLKSEYDTLNSLAAFGRVDYGSKNTTFASRPRKYYLGLTMPIPIKTGFWNVGLAAYKENNHNGIIGKEVEFDTTWAVSSAWNVPYGPGSFGGFINMIGPKGNDGFGNNTKTETLFRVSYLFDVGSTNIKIGPAYEYWRNMYGNDEQLDGTHGSKGNVPMLISQFKF
ncbi:hypothetical protein ACKVE0_03370 [Acinetobacter albensis]|uniref:Nucleoside-specific outer membrane channel protein Tsx n=1 Tax=Acinetobacter albensis TaxID=1673609 RepID=A0ABW9JQA7_9GAMM